MSSHAIRNLEELEDQARAHGVGELEARFARQPLGAEGVGLSLQRLAPDARLPFGHRHGVDEEIYVVTAGSGQVLIDGEVTDVRRWDAIRVAPSAVRAFAAGPDGLELLVFGTHTEGDPEMMQVDWPG